MMILSKTGHDYRKIIAVIQNTSKELCLLFIFKAQLDKMKKERKIMKSTKQEI